MKKINNPFIIKGAIPAQYFCDRVKETEILTNHIQNGRNVLLTAPRRIGKTGLIAHCFQTPEWEQDFYIFFIDILETSSLRDLTFALGRQIFEALKPRSKQMVDLFVQTVRSVSGEFGYDPISGMPKFTLSLGAIQNPEYTLSEIFDYINKADKRCLIAIDEFQQIVHYPEKNIEAILRTHIQHCKNADFIFAGSERHILEEMFNLPSRPFYASTANMSLDAIAMDVYTDSVMEQCTLSIIEKAIADILSDGERNYKNRLALLTPKPKELLIAIAKERKASRVTSGEFIRKYHLSSSSSVQSALKQLLQDDWITYSANEQGQKEYLLSDPFLACWLVENF